MPFHLIAGAGVTGATTALLLAEAGERVRVVTRRGVGPDHPLIEKIAADVTDADRLSAIGEGAQTIYGCAAPPYHMWPAAFPPLHAALLTAAERTGAGYVMLGNHYGYGPVDGAVTEDLPLTATGPKGRTRARMWEKARAAYGAGRVRVTEVRASQFLGPGAVSMFSLMVQPRVLAGELALVSADLDVPHSYSYVPDVARTLIAVGRSEMAWGRVWHAPATITSVRDLARGLAEVAAAPEPRITEMTERELALLGLTDPFWAELPETDAMSRRPFVVDCSRVERVFGLRPTPLKDVLLDIVGAR